MAKPTLTKLKLSAIHIGEGTQQREIDAETLVAYTELIGDGAEFPPIEVVHDGKTYHLWDGFHRYFAHRDAGKATILANIRTGTLRDAIWLSFSANKDHGLPRQQARAAGNRSPRGRRARRRPRARTMRRSRR